MYDETVSGGVFGQHLLVKQERNHPILTHADILTFVMRDKKNFENQVEWASEMFCFHIGCKIHFLYCLS